MHKRPGHREHRYEVALCGTEQLVKRASQRAPASRLKCPGRCRGWAWHAGQDRPGREPSLPSSVFYLPWSHSAARHRREIKDASTGQLLPLARGHEWPAHLAMICACLLLCQTMDHTGMQLWPPWYSAAA
jgi:hypothetical protein